MAYDTGNPVGSTDARDLSDNAQNLDIAVNGNKSRWTDRLGVSRPTWAGIAAYVDRGAYAAGIEIIGYNEIFIYGGEYYRAKASTVLPYTTNGTWSTDDDFFVPIGDAALRQDITNDADTTIGHYRNAVNCNQYGGLNAAFASSDTLGKIIVVTDAQAMTANIDTAGRGLVVEYGGMITTTGFTLANNAPFEAGDYQVFSGSGTVTGLKESRPEWFSPNTTPGTTDMTAAIQKAINAASASWDPATYGSTSPYGSPTVKFKAELYKSGALTIDKSVLLAGDGPTEFSAGTRLISSVTTNAALLTVDPIAQGCSFQIRDITLRGAGTGTGSLLVIKNTISAVNSIRIHNTIFGTPDSLALSITGSDDVIVSNSLFDVAAANAIYLDTVSNVRFIAPTFFAIGLKAFVLKDVQNLTIDSPHAYGASSITFSNQFIDGVDAAPTYLRNIKVIGGNFSNYNILSNMSNSENISFIGNSLTRSVANASDTMSIVRFIGTTAGIQFIGNTIKSGLATHKFLDTSSATNTIPYVISGNSFVNLSSAAGKAMAVTSTAKVSGNTFDGFNESYISERYISSGSAITPGTIAALGTYTQNLTQYGVSQAQNVIVSPVDTVWMVPAGIVVTAYISAPDTITVKYTNHTAAPIAIPAHDISIQVLN